MSIEVRRCNRLIAAHTTAPLWANTNNLFDGVPGTNPGTYASWVRPPPDSLGLLYVGFDLSDVPWSAVLRAVRVRYRIYIEDPNQMRFTTVGATVVRYPDIIFAQAEASTELLPYAPETRQLEVPLYQAQIPLDINALRDPNFAVGLQIQRSNQGGNSTAYVDHIDVEFEFGATRVWSEARQEWVGGLPRAWKGEDWHPLRIRHAGLWI